MTPICSLVLAGLCVQAPFDQAVNLNAMYAFSDGTGIAQPDVVKRLGVRIEAYQSDNIVERQSAGLPRACVGDKCVLYLKTCSADRLACEWDWGAAPNAPGGPFGTLTVWITATSHDAMERAEQAISVERGSRSGAVTAYVPLTAMNRLSSLAYLPPCIRRDAGPDCVNLFLGRVPEAPTAPRSGRSSSAPSLR